MKKVLLALVAVLSISAFVLTACGGTKPEAVGSAEAAAAQIHEVGDFTVKVPTGWTAFPQVDIFGTQDKDGNYPTATDAIVLGKDVTNEADALSGPNVRINSYELGQAPMDPSLFYDNVKDLNGVVINGTECSASIGSSLDYEYQFIKYDVNEHHYEIQILQSIKGESTGISWEDADVQLILESLS